MQNGWMPWSSPGMTERDGAYGSLVDQCARALVGEEFEQDRVRLLAIDDDDALNALFERVDAGLYLRDHAARNRAVGDQLARILDRKVRNQLLRFVEHAGHVGQEQQPLGLERTGHRAGKGVGIDVEGLAAFRSRERRQHRYQLVADDLVQQREIDLFRFAHESEIDDLFDMGVRIDHG